MDSLFYDLLVRIVALINAQADVIAAGATAEVGRVAPVTAGDLPLIGVFLAGDATVGEFGQQNLNFIDWDVAVAVEVALDGDATVTTDELTRLYQNLRAACHNAIMADAPTLSLSFVSMAYPLGGDQPNLSQEGARKTVNYRFQFGFRVRTSLTDMTTT